jgi:queuine tRNA-ribosyltransferase
MPKRIFRSKTGNFELPIFFPDATRAFVRAVDPKDLEDAETIGILVNTYHLYKDLGAGVVKEFSGIKNFMGWKGVIISDSGGFQVMTLAKRGKIKGKIDDRGVTFKPIGDKIVTMTPEDSIRFQMDLQTDLLVVLDDFTPPNVSYEVAEESVRRTLLWARRSKEEFAKICKKRKIANRQRPYLIGVVQGGEYLELRKKCTQDLVNIGFDGLGYGGWPITADGIFNYDVAKVMADNSPADYLLYGLGIGKPDEIVKCYGLGFEIFDCVLPTRDARHKRLYVYNADSIDEIDVSTDKFYSYYIPGKDKHRSDKSPVSKACDCLLCKNYSRAYLAHLFRSKETSALRLATIHNLRFYSLLMEKIAKSCDSK